MTADSTCCVVSEARSPVKEAWDSTVDFDSDPGSSGLPALVLYSWERAA